VLLQRNSFKDAHVCLFVFDCLHYNGETLLDKFVFETFPVLLSVRKVAALRVAVAMFNCCFTAVT